MIQEFINIHASAERVWNILQRLDQYSQWNPFIRRAWGQVREGRKIAMLVKMPGGWIMPMTPFVITCQDHRELSWRGHLLIPGLFDGYHRIILKSFDTHQVRVIQEEVFSGLLVPFFGKWVKAAAQSGFKEMNDALKVIAETPEKK
jgi:hypothetical protein